MTTKTNSIDNSVKKIVNRNLLKYAAGQAIFCPQCNAIMDYRKTVIATIQGIKQGESALSNIKTYVICKPCWKKHGSKVTDAVTTMQSKFPDNKVCLELVFEGKL